MLRCDGMLSQAAYRAIFEAGQRGGLIIEVGTALGAATTALALGLQESGLPGKIVSFDPMLRGPRRQISTVEARVQHVRSNLAHFGVAELVEIVPSTLPEGLGALPPGQPISVLMLDADGRLDRDLLLVFHRLVPDCTIIIDDLADKVRLKRERLFTFSIDAKMRLAHRMVRILKDDGVITPGRTIKETYFGKKGTTTRLDPVRFLDAYHGLVFMETTLTPAEVIRRLVVRTLEKLAPFVLQRLRVIKRRGVSSAKPKLAIDSHVACEVVLR